MVFAIAKEAQEIVENLNKLREETSSNLESTKSIHAHMLREVTTLIEDFNAGEKDIADYEKFFEQFGNISDTIHAVNRAIMTEDYLLKSMVKLTDKTN